MARVDLTVNIFYLSSFVKRKGGHIICLSYSFVVNARSYFLIVLVPESIFRHHCAPRSAGPVVALCKLTAEVEIRRVDFPGLVFTRILQRKTAFTGTAERTQGSTPNLSTSWYFHSFKHYQKITAATTVTYSLFLSSDACCAFEGSLHVTIIWGCRSSFREADLLC